MPKAKSKKCSTDGCRKKRAKNKGYCHACNKRRYRKANPMMASYQALKSNSKRRGHFFDLTFEQFRQFCYETEYMAKKGRSSLSYSVDRIIEELGYTVGNLQALTNRDNVLKEHDRRRVKKTLVYDYATGWATVHKSTPPPHYTESVI